MAVLRPFKWGSGTFDGRTFPGFQRWNDSELDNFAYKLRAKYADSLFVGNAGVPGGLMQGGSQGTEISTLADDRFLGNQGSFADTPNPGPGSSPQGTNFKPISQMNVMTYRFRFNSTPVGEPNDTAYNDNMYMTHRSGFTFEYRKSEQDIIDTIITECISEMRTGDEVGTYRVAASNPNSSEWEDKGLWFADTKYSDTIPGINAAADRPVAGNADKRLFLKMRSTPKGTDVPAFRHSETVGTRGYQLVNVNDIIDGLFLTILQRRISNGLTYSIDGAASAGNLNRGTWANTRKPTQTQFQQLTSGTYFFVSYPTGLVSQTQFLI